MTREYAIDTEDVEDRNELRKCLGCGYGLSGLAEEGVCPECGMPYGGELVLTGFTSRGGPRSTMITGIVFLLLGSIELLMVLINTPHLVTFEVVWGSLFNICSIFGAIMLAVGLRGIAVAGRHGGNLRWVLNQEGIYTIWGDRSERKLVPWQDVRRVAIPLVLGIRPRRWRVLKVRRGWRSWDLFRRKTPMLWLKGKTRSEMRVLTKKIHDQFKS